MKTLKNKVQLIGHLGQDPERVQFDNGNQLTKLRLATNEYFKNSKGEKVEETYWHNLIAWGKTGELAHEYLKKGHEIAVEGKISNRKWQDKEGKDHLSTEIVVSEFLMLDKKKQ